MLSSLKSARLVLSSSCCRAKVGSKRLGPAARLNTSASEIAAVNAKGKGKWMITDAANKGFGIFAQKHFEPNELVFQAKCVVKSERDSHSVQTSWTDHVQMDLPAILLNHSCDANVGVVANSLGAYDFVSVKPIAEGEEITLDYGVIEFESVSFQDCLCGTPKCRGRNIGFKFAHNAIREQYGDYYAPYLHDWSPDKN